MKIEIELYELEYDLMQVARNPMYVSIGLTALRLVGDLLTSLV